MIGYEFEFLVREGNAPLSKKIFLAFHSLLQKRGWTPIYDAGTKGLLGSKRGDIFVGTDDGVCIMEINMPPRQKIQACDTELRRLLAELQTLYLSLGCSIIGISTFPGAFDRTNHDCITACTHDVMCEKTYIKHFNTQRFNTGHHALLIIAANQVWLDVEKIHLMREWRLFNSLSPLFVALFANGPIMNTAPLPVLEGRDYAWHEMLDTSIVPTDSKLFGMPNTLSASLIEYVDHLMDIPFYCSLRDGKGFKLADPKKTYKDFLFSKQSDAVWFDGTPFTASPDITDFLQLHHVSWPHARIKYRVRLDVTLADILDAYASRRDDALLGCFSQVFLECRCISAQPQ
ncbi:MAG: glutamate-cysteine ligase family protein, partial [Patescibacteria group bacterium]